MLPILIEVEISQFVSGMHAMTQGDMSDDKLVHTKIRETFERAFWSSLLDDMCAIPCSYSRVLSVLREIREGVQVQRHKPVFVCVLRCRLLPSYTHTHTQALTGAPVFYVQSLSKDHPEYQKIQDVIDLDFITQQLKNDAFSYGDCTSLIDNIVKVSMKSLLNLSMYYGY